jgi:similarities with mutator mutT protein homolog and NTP pyrophosphohydrolase
MIKFYHTMTEILKNIKSAYRVAVKGLVRNQSGKLLFVQERSDSWDLPGGGLERGENIVEALTREFREELGVDITIDSDRPRIIPTWNTKFDDPVLIIIYEVTLLTTPCLTDEVSNFNYFDIHEIKQEKLDSTLIGKLLEIY